MTVAATESLATLLRRIATNNVGGSDRDLPRRASHIVIEAADRLDELSAALSNTPKWIPCSEREPPLLQYVNVWREGLPVSTDKMMLIDGAPIWVHDCDQWTHWMPLLSAPEAK